MTISCVSSVAFIQEGIDALFIEFYLKLLIMALNNRNLLR